jgi:hypothetical protein
LKIDEKWYRMEERKTIKNWQWIIVSFLLF